MFSFFETLFFLTVLCFFHIEAYFLYMYFVLQYSVPTKKKERKQSLFTHYRTRTDNPVGADFESAVFTYFTK